MATEKPKLIKPHGEQKTDIETQVENCLKHMELTAELKPYLKELYITGVKEIDVKDSTTPKSVLVVFFPVPQLKAFQKAHSRLVRELEKKLSTYNVLLVAQRKILPKQTRKLKQKQKQKRPRSRTLTAVHEAMLDDICYPAEIVGKRTHVRTDGTRWLEVFLDRKNGVEVNNLSLSSVYRKMTGKEVKFTPPSYQHDGYAKK